MPDLATSLDLCTYCPRLCSHACPVSLVEGRETVTPQAKMSLLWALRRDSTDPPASPHTAILPPPSHLEVGGPGTQPPGSPGASADAAARERSASRGADPIYACTGCGACTEVCLHGVQPGQVLVAGRALAESRHLGHPALKDLPRRHEDYAQGVSAAVSAAVPEERRSVRARVAFLPACGAAAMGGTGPGGGPAREALRALAVYDRLAVTRSEADLAIAAPRTGCAGYPLYAGGFVEEFKIYAEHFAADVAGHDTLVLSCAACVYALRVIYPQSGVPLRPQVLHVSEHLAPMAPDLPVRRTVRQAVYHDPCHLGRQLGVYEVPRTLLHRAVAGPVEFPRSHQAAACCGAAGLLPLTMPDTARAMAAERLGELDELEAPPADQVIVTGCPGCQSQLAGTGGARVLDLLELLDEVTRP